MRADWASVSFVRSSSYRTRVLGALAKPKAPAELSRELKIHIAHVSKTLGELEKRDLVECLTPAARKGRLYRRTEAGDRLLKVVQDQ
ncbi:MAG: ArsR family transcriptional regulator [Halobacteria archaeon]